MDVIIIGVSLIYVACVVTSIAIALRDRNLAKGRQCSQDQNG